MAPDAKVFVAGPQALARYLDPAAAGGFATTFTDTGGALATNRFYRIRRVP